MTPYLICYDIDNDRIRKKIADHLLAAGLDRIQYSVFIGPVKEGVMSQLMVSLERLMQQAKGTQDSLLCVRLTVSQVEKVRILGTKKVDIAGIAGIRHTLFL